jgi:hypothetical protein
MTRIPNAGAFVVVGSDPYEVLQKLLDEAKMYAGVPTTILLEVNWFDDISDEPQWEGYALVTE